MESAKAPDQAPAQNIPQYGLQKTIEDTLRQWIPQAFIDETIRQSNLVSAAHDLIGPAFDVAEDGDKLTVKVDLPGFRKEDIRINLKGDALSIRAQRRDEGVRGTFLLKQRPTAPVVEKTIRLRSQGASNAEYKPLARPSYENGVLTMVFLIPSTTSFLVQ